MIEIKKTTLTDLGILLIDYIKSRTNIFNTINVVVPNSKTEQWFKSYWLKTQNDILMNVKFETIDDAMLKLIANKEQFKLLNKDKFKLLVIKNLLNKKEVLDLPSSIYSYIDESKDNSAIRLYDLATKLTDLFIEYENDQFEITGWQKELYEYVLMEASFNHFSTLSNIYNSISKKETVEINKDIYFFGFHKLNSLYESILSNYEGNDHIIMMSLELTNEYSNEIELVAAPSKLREIESLHSKICKLISEKNIEYNDVLVLCTDISSYENVIARVFKQDNVEFYNLPYVINDRKKIETNVYKGLDILFQIINKGYYTRLDFFNLINNKDIQESRLITDEDVRNWSESIISMNAFRNFDNRNDWEYAKRRVLLSKISNINDIDDNIIEFIDGAYIPFSNIGFDDDSIIKFVKLIDDLQSWIDNLSNIKYVNKDNLNIFKCELEKWFSIKDNNDFETNEYYKNIVSLLETWNNLISSEEFIPYALLVYMLLDASKVTKVKSRDYFVKGVTFSNFDIDAILSAKYIFFLNAGSKELPSQTFKSEIDLRDYDISEKEKYLNAFFLQYQNAGKKFFISYLNKNLKTDEELYLSSFVVDLYKKITNNNELKVSDIKKELVSIDETRPWGEIFTKKTYKDKEYYSGLIGKKVEESNQINNELVLTSERRKKIRSKEMADFLEEPLKYKVSYLFSKDDELEQKMNDEYEPFESDAMSSALLIKNLALYALENRVLTFDIETVNKLLNKFNLGRKLPNINKGINEFSFRKIIDESQKIINCISLKTFDNYELINLEDLTLIDNNENKQLEWTITCKDKVCRYINEDSIVYVQVKKLIGKDEAYQYLQLYVMSLMDIVNFPEKEYTIELVRNADFSRCFVIKPTEAKEILASIYNLMNDFTDNVCLPIKLFNDDINSLHNFVKELNENVWKYFSDKKMFDYYTQLGYTEDNFKKKYNQKRSEVIALVKYLPQETKESEENKNE